MSAYPPSPSPGGGDSVSNAGTAHHLGLSPDDTHVASMPSPPNLPQQRDPVAETPHPRHGSATRTESSAPASSKRWWSPRSWRRQRRRITPMVQPRIVINTPFVPPPGAAVDEPSYVFASNRIATSKYSLLTFVPKNLFEQFRSIANFYFTALVILQIFPQFETTSIAVVAAPIIIILALTAAKDGFEDWRRHRSDAEVNGSFSYTLSAYENRNQVHAPGEKIIFLSAVSDWWISTMSKLRVTLGWGVSKAPEAKSHPLPKTLKPDVYLKDSNRFRDMAIIEQPPVPSSPSRLPALQEHPTVFDDAVTMSPIDLGTFEFGSGPPLGGLPSQPFHESAAFAVSPPPQLSRSQSMARSTTSHSVRRKNLSLHHHRHHPSHTDLTTWHLSEWQQLRVGDFVLLQNNDPIPADVLLISTSEADNECYVETKNLDGETNLKIRTGVPALSWVMTPEDCRGLRLIIDQEPFNSNLYQFSASLTVDPVESPSAFLDHGGAVSPGANPYPNLMKRMSTSASNTGVDHIPMATLTAAKSFNGKDRAATVPVRVPLGLNNTLLRGSIMRNTKWSIAIVLAAGSESKVMLNTGPTPSKRSLITRRMNAQVILNFMILVALCLVCAIVSALYQGTGIWEASPFFGFGNEYDSTGTIGVITFFVAMILFQNIIPIALYISVEFGKTAQSLLLHFDRYMVHDEQGVNPRSWNLVDDLGQIEYIFSDKTGTLTSNTMEFKKCSINGIVYGGSFAVLQQRTTEEQREFDTQRRTEEQAMREQLTQRYNTRYLSQKPLSFVDVDIVRDLDDDEQGAKIREMFSILALCHTVLVEEVRDDDTEASTPSDVSENPNASMSRLQRHRQRIRSVLGIRGRNGTRSRSNLRSSESSTSSVGSSPNHEVVAHSGSALPIDPATIPEVPLVNPFHLEYKAQSPDEAALVDAAKNMGFTFLRRKEGNITLDLMGETRHYELLNVIEFNSDRKRMSVIVRRPEGQIVLLCKGADSVIFSRLSARNDKEITAVTMQHLEDFANDGLRTLCLAYKPISQQDYDAWNARWTDAQNLVQGRDEATDAVADELERELTLAGASAIEDRLQDGVPQAIATLAEAGIKIFVLTGDKMETAINIGFSCNLLQKSMVLIVIQATSVEGVIEQLVEALARFWPSVNATTATKGNDMAAGAAAMASSQTFEEAAQAFGLIIDGESLKYALDEKAHPFLLELACRCKAVICCRVSPQQKALVVRLVREGLSSMSLAIGDGANDVSMIQEADIGVGITGKEGLQAVMASDYAIGQFRFLTRLLLVHGRWGYLRTSEMVLNYFYKNVVFLFVLFWFQFDSAFSANYVCDYTYVMFFNTLFSVLPTINIGILDQDISAETALKYPPGYMVGVRQTRYTMDRAWLWQLDAVYQSFICYYVPRMIVHAGSISNDGHATDLATLGTMVAWSMIITINLQCWLDTTTHNWITDAAFFITMLIFVVYSTANSAGDPMLESHGVAANVMSTGIFWLGIFFSIICSLAPRYAYRMFRLFFALDDTQILKEISNNERKARVRAKAQAKREGRKHQKQERTAEAAVAAATAHEHDMESKHEANLDSRSSISLGLSSLRRSGQRATAAADSSIHPVTNEIDLEQQNTDEEEYSPESRLPPLDLPGEGITIGSLPRVTEASPRSKPTDDSPGCSFSGKKVPIAPPERAPPSLHFSARPSDINMLNPSTAPETTFGLLAAPNILGDVPGTMSPSPSMLPSHPDDVRIGRVRNSGQRLLNSLPRLRIGRHPTDGLIGEDQPLVPAPSAYLEQRSLRRPRMHISTADQTSQQALSQPQLAEQPVTGVNTSGLDLRLASRAHRVRNRIISLTNRRRQNRSMGANASSTNTSLVYMSGSGREMPHTGFAFSHSGGMSQVMSPGGASVRGSLDVSGDSPLTAIAGFGAGHERAMSGPWGTSTHAILSQRESMIDNTNRSSYFQQAGLHCTPLSAMVGASMAGSPTQPGLPHGAPPHLPDSPTRGSSILSPPPSYRDMATPRTNLASGVGGDSPPRRSTASRDEPLPRRSTASAPADRLPRPRA